MANAFLKTTILACAGLAAAGDSEPFSLAVLPFTGQGVDSVSALVVTDALSDELLRTGKVQVMERSQIRSILDEQGLQQSGACEGSECAVQTGRLLAVQDVVVGTIGKLGDSYSLSVRLVDVATGQVARSAHRMQQGAIDVVVAQALPQIAAELLGEAPTVVRAQRRPSPDSLWEGRHAGLHFRSQLVVGISSVTEAPFGVRLGVEYDGFGAMLGASPLVPILASTDNLGDKRIRWFIPGSTLFYGWGRYQANLGFSRLDLRETSGSDREETKILNYSADLVIHLGLPGKPQVPGGFGVLVGLGFVDFKRTNSYSFFDGTQTVTRSDVVDNWGLPILNFAILLSDW